MVPVRLFPTPVLQRSREAGGRWVKSVRRPLAQAGHLYLCSKELPPTTTPHPRQPWDPAGGLGLGAPALPRGLGGTLSQREKTGRSPEAHAFIRTHGREASCGRQSGHLQAGGTHLLPAAVQTHEVTSRAPAPAQQPLPARPPPIVPGSFSHLGTLPRSLLTGCATPGLGSGDPTAPSSVGGSNSRGTGSGAGSRGGVPAALDMHLWREGRGTRWWAP